jgi:hypothetical protein
VPRSPSRRTAPEPPVMQIHMPAKLTFQGGRSVSHVSSIIFHFVDPVVRNRVPVFELCVMCQLSGVFALVGARPEDVGLGYYDATTGMHMPHAARVAWIYNRWTRGAVACPYRCRHCWCKTRSYSNGSLLFDKKGVGEAEAASAVPQLDS